MEKLPKWFLAVALSVILSIGPLYFHLEKRITLLEDRAAHVDKTQDRLIGVLDRMDVTLRELSITFTELKTEVKNLKQESQK